MSKNIIFLLIFVFAIFSCAEPDPIFYFTKGDVVDLKVPCIRNNTACSPAAECNITINYHNGTNYIKNQQMTNNGVYHNYTLGFSDTLGVYYTSVFCQDGSDNGYSLFSFEINNYGRDEQGSGVIFFLALIPVIALLIICLIWANIIKTDNEFSMGPDGEKILEIKYGLYLKLLLYFFAYIFFWILTFLSWKISDVIISLSVYSDFVKYIFILSSILIVPIFIIVTVIGMIKHMTDSELLRLHKRGLNPR